MFNFKGESEAWSLTFWAALFGKAGPEDDAKMTKEFVKGAERLANEAEALLAGRAKAREAQAAQEAEARRERIEVAVAHVREVGAYARTRGDDVGHVFDVTAVYGNKIQLTARAEAGRDRSLDIEVDLRPRFIPIHLEVDALEMMDAAWLAEEHAFVEAPAKALRGLVARLKVAVVLGHRTEDVVLAWNMNPDENEKAVIVDVVLSDQLRPSRAGWLALEAAGLPMMGFDSAKLDWDP